jgi:hypothetical protein
MMLDARMCDVEWNFLDTVHGIQLVDLLFVDVGSWMWDVGLMEYTFGCSLDVGRGLWDSWDTL